MILKKKIIEGTKIKHHLKKNINSPKHIFKISHFQFKYLHVDGISDLLAAILLFRSAAAFAINSKSCGDGCAFIELIKQTLKIEIKHKLDFMMDRLF